MLFHSDKQGVGRLSKVKPLALRPLSITEWLSWDASPAVPVTQHVFSSPLALGRATGKLSTTTALHNLSQDGGQVTQGLSLFVSVRPKMLKESRAAVTTHGGPDE